MCFRTLKNHCSKKTVAVSHPMVRMLAHLIACFVVVFALCWFG